MTKKVLWTVIEEYAGGATAHIYIFATLDQADAHARGIVQEDWDALGLGVMPDDWEAARDKMIENGHLVAWVEIQHSTVDLTGAEDA